MGTKLEKIGDSSEVYSIDGGDRYQIRLILDPEMTRSIYVETDTSGKADTISRLWGELKSKLTKRVRMEDTE